MQTLTTGPCVLVPHHSSHVLMSTGKQDFQEARAFKPEYILEFLPHSCQLVVPSSRQATPDQVSYGKQPSTMPTTKCQHKHHHLHSYRFATTKITKHTNMASSMHAVKQFLFLNPLTKKTTVFFLLSHTLLPSSLPLFSKHA